MGSLNPLHCTVFAAMTIWQISATIIQWSHNNVLIPQWKPHPDGCAQSPAEHSGICLVGGKNIAGGPAAPTVILYWPWGPNSIPLQAKCGKWARVWHICIRWAHLHSAQFVSSCHCWLLCRESQRPPKSVQSLDWSGFSPPLLLLLLWPTFTSKSKFSSSSSSSSSFLSCTAPEPLPFKMEAFVLLLVVCFCLYSSLRHWMDRWWLWQCGAGNLPFVMSQSENAGWLAGHGEGILTRLRRPSCLIVFFFLSTH